jgi:hypothetical protein
VAAGDVGAVPKRDEAAGCGVRRQSRRRSMEVAAGAESATAVAVRGIAAAVAAGGGHGGRDGHGGIRRARRDPTDTGGGRWAQEAARRPRRAPDPAAAARRPWRVRDPVAVAQRPRRPRDPAALELAEEDARRHRVEWTACEPVLERGRGARARRPSATWLALDSRVHLPRGGATPARPWPAEGRRRNWARSGGATGVGQGGRVNIPRPTWKVLLPFHAAHQTLITAQLYL